MYDRTALAQLLHQAVHIVEEEALNAWRKEYAPGDSIEDGLALYARELITVVKRLRGGIVSVTVSVVGRWHGHSETYYFSLQIDGNGTIYRLEPMSTSR